MTSVSAWDTLLSPRYARSRLRRIQLHRGDVAASESPWRPDDLVIRSLPHYGRYGDAVWRFGNQGVSGGGPARYNLHWSVGADNVWPSDEWVTTGRDLAMALLGRRPERRALVDSRNAKGVVQRLSGFGVIARWAHDRNLGLPPNWDSTTVERFMEDARQGRLPRRDRGPNREKAASDRTLQNYLQIFYFLWLYRGQVTSGMRNEPWPNIDVESATTLSGAHRSSDVAVSTDVIDPKIWWALIRFAQRFVNVYAPDIIPAWRRVLAQRNVKITPGPVKGPRPIQQLTQFASDPRSCVPVNEDRSVCIKQLGWSAGINYQALDPAVNLWSADQCWQIVNDMVDRGRTTRYWHGQVSDVRLPNGRTGPWVDCLDTAMVTTLGLRLRDACYILIVALTAMRDSEAQGIRRGCVGRNDGTLTIRSEIIKHEAQPRPELWWIDPVAKHCVTLLEALGESVEVREYVDGALVPSDRLFFSTARGNFGKAGIGRGDEAVSDCIKWINDNAERFGFPRGGPNAQDAIPERVTPHQLRVTFAAVAALVPDGPIGVQKQLHDSFALAAAYMANPDEKWLDVHRRYRQQVTVARLRRYLFDGDIVGLVGPGAEGFRDDLGLIDNDIDALLDEDEPDYAEFVDKLLLTAGHTFGTSTLSHCRGRSADARCAAAAKALDPDVPFTPNFEADVCFAPTECKNVIYDPPEHLPVWDVALQALQHEQHQLGALADQPLRHIELERAIADAEHRIERMESACRLRPLPSLKRLRDELERYLDFIRFETEIPGVAAEYRHLYLAAKRRVFWIRDLLPDGDRPEWSISVTEMREPLWLHDDLQEDPACR